MINRPNVLFYAQREDGPLKSKSEKYAKEQQIYTDFAGGLHYEKMVGMLTAEILL